MDYSQIRTAKIESEESADDVPGKQPQNFDKSGSSPSFSAVGNTSDEGGAELL